ncbi:MAG: IucA/IucC family protein [Mycobacteriales bacterium]
MTEALATHAPDLVDAFTRALPRATAAVTAQLLGALYREDVAGLRRHGRRTGGLLRCPLPGGELTAPVEREHAFARLAFTGQVRYAGRPVTDPTRLLALLVPDAGPLPAELHDAVANLALGYARAGKAADDLRLEADLLGATDLLALASQLRAVDPAFEPTVFFERLSTEGHNLHPCARTRLGMDPAAVLRHDLEAVGTTSLVLVAAARDRVHVAPDEHGRDVGTLLCREYPDLAAATAGFDPDRWVLLPVHAWQLDHVLPIRYTAELAAGLLVPVPAARLAAEPTSSLRTLLTEPSPAGRRWFVKTALDVQVTSTRRTISVPTTQNGPVLSRLLAAIVAGEPALAGRVLALPELAGASFVTGAADRGLAALVRAGITDQLGDGELAVPGCALYARSPLSGRSVLCELVAASGLAPLDWLDRYADLLLSAVCQLATCYGVGLEAHLQNSVPVFAGGVPVRIAFRDWGGMRVYGPRLAARGLRFDAWPGSVTATGEVAAMRAKVGYTAFQNHLGEVVAQLATGCGVPEPACWDRIGTVLRRVYAPLLADPATAAAADGDLACWQAPTAPHKALVTMRLGGDGDRYVPVPNPLAR